MDHSFCPILPPPDLNGCVNGPSLEPAFKWSILGGHFLPRTIVTLFSHTVLASSQNFPPGTPLSDLSRSTPTSRPPGHYSVVQSPQCHNSWMTAPNLATIAKTPCYLRQKRTPRGLSCTCPPTPDSLYIKLLLRRCPLSRSTTLFFENYPNLLRTILYCVIYNARTLDPVPSAGHPPLREYGHCPDSHLCHHCRTGHLPLQGTNSLYHCAYLCPL